MSGFIIKTARLDLVLQQPAEILAHLAEMSPEDRAQVSPVWLARARAAVSADPWLHGFLIIEQLTGDAVGSCGFKGPPDAEGIVELAYGVNPDRQGLGYATESAKALADFAFDTGIVRGVCAHTLPTGVSSQRVLTKAGFKLAGEVVDPEDGLVLRWERFRTPA